MVECDLNAFYIITISSLLIALLRIFQSFEFLNIFDTILNPYDCVVVYISCANTTRKYVQQESLFTV